jgi:hypothetical protein
MLAYQMAWCLFLLVTVFGIFFLLWVFMHLCKTGKSSGRRNLSSSHLQKAQRRIKAEWDAAS